ncbi:MAG: SulP family inorganic anion transporter [Candidatus Didemnitutus sp.]|nr:SulP family inorganic anion transporter [Candidatus Didemnitutus sp.]
MSDLNVLFSKQAFAFRPKVLEILAGYSRDHFLRDVGAGLTVGVVALSLCIGFGISSGVSPAAGLYAGVIGGFLVSALGGSRVQIGGPAGAFVGLIALVMAEYGLANLLLCTMMAGVILFLLGALRLGNLIKFVPHPVTTGFTCGIAITILMSQFRPFLGLQLEREPAEFLPKLVALIRALPTIDWPTLSLAALSLAILVFWPKRWSRVPGSIVAVAVGTVLVAGFDWPTETIGSKFGGIPQGLPTLVWPQFDWQNLGGLIRPAFTIAVLGAIESLLSAVVADGLIDDRHDSNQELMAQGAANFVSPLFGGMPVTGVIARTATNIRSGANSPVAGLVHALFLLLVLLVAAPLASDIPLATVAAVLVVVAVRMGEWEEFAVLRRRPRLDVAVFLATFALTVIFDLTVAVEVGMVLAAFAFIKRVADTTQVLAMTGEETAVGGPGHEPAADLPRGVVVYRVFGALLFGSAEKLEHVIRRAGGEARVVILHIGAVTAMDATALNRIESLHAKMRRRREQLILCGPHTQPYFLLEKAGFFDVLGRENVCADLGSALARARVLLAGPQVGASRLLA